ncbi:MAG: hypothetical protein HKN32_03835, partial [Flavobacteriales bacterium]|nr:hypothetical protein [Flavobacteriales bacterium]
MNRLLSLLLVACASTAMATHNPVFSDDPLEITFYNADNQGWDYTTQQFLRELPAWQNFLAEHGTWYVHFNESNQKPHRAYGQPIAVAGMSAEEIALNFISNELGGFGLDVDELFVYATPETK